MFQIAMSDFHTLFLTDDGCVMSCGHGAGGRLGHGDENAQVTPKIIEIFHKTHVISISTSNNHSLAITEDGDAYSWGDNSKSLLGE